jgi:hypothetical protein
LIAASSVGKCLLIFTARRNFAFKAPAPASGTKNWMGRATDKALTEIAKLAVNQEAEAA